MKLFSKNNLLISLLSSALSATFLTSPGYAMDVPDDDWKPMPSSQSPRSSAITLPDDPLSNKYYKAVTSLFHSQNLEEKERGAVAFREIIQNKTHPHYSDALYNLFTWGSKKDKAVLAPCVREMIQAPNALKRYSLADSLIMSFDPENKAIALKVLREITQNSGDPDYFASLKFLFLGGNKKDKELARF